MRPWSDEVDALAAGFGVSSWLVAHFPVQQPPGVVAVAEFGVSPWLVAHRLRNHEIARDCFGSGTVPEPC